MCNLGSKIDQQFNFTDEDTLCDDAEYSTVNDRFQNIWLNGEVYYSYDACDGKNNDSKLKQNTIRAPL